MLKICKQFSCKYNVVFNADKSKLIVYLNIQISVNDINITFQSKESSAESGGVHLGNVIGKISIENASQMEFLNLIRGLMFYY